MESLKVSICIALAILPFYASAMMIEGKQMTMDDAIIKAGSNSTKMYELMQDAKTVMVELDMLYDMDTYMEMRKEMKEAENDDEESGSRKKRKAVRGDFYRWPGAVVPYEINTYDMSTRDIGVINAAIRDYHTYTCLRFRQARSTDRDRIRFQNGGGCSSYVGKIGGTQSVSLASGCRYKGIVIHEMGHAIGFNHEQTRPDRDGFVYIATQNIQRGLEYNFNKYTTAQQNAYGVPYDYRSVMHYSQYAFSVNGQRTIVARNSAYQNSMGNRAGLSFSDVRLANAMYSCASNNNCAARSCPSGGFQGQDCRCYCDSGDLNSPLMVCGSTGATTPQPGTTTVEPASCVNKHTSCDYWSQQGYCTGTYVVYMTANCPRACNLCSAMTTTTTTTTTRAPSTCTNDNTNCDYWAGVGECTRNPSYMHRYCMKACDRCDTTTNTCVDGNTNCPNWTQYCTSDVYADYLRMNCRLSCGHCTANDETVPTTTVAPSSSEECENLSSESYCERQHAAGRCAHSINAMRRCKKTCNKC